MNLHSAVSEDAQRPGKSKAAFRTISEVSDELDVPQHVLRFWESKFPQVKPLKRGGGRRYYRPADIDLLRRIRDLLYKDGYTIKGVQKLLKEGGRAAEAAPPAPQETVEPPQQDAVTPPPDETEDSAEPLDAAEPAEGGLDPAKRQELEGILAELLDLRALLS